MHRIVLPGLIVSYSLLLADSERAIRQIEVAGILPVRCPSSCLYMLRLFMNELFCDYVCVFVVCLCDVSLCLPVYDYVTV